MTFLVPKECVMGLPVEASIDAMRPYFPVEAAELPIEAYTLTVLGEETIPDTVPVEETGIYRTTEAPRKVKNLTYYGIWTLCRQHFQVAIPVSPTPKLAIQTATPILDRIRAKLKEWHERRYAELTRS
jgi:hypothetical protein